MEDKKLYTTIPEAVVKKLFTSVTPVTITYAKKDMFDYLCNIMEFSGYNCPYWATLDFEEAFFRKEDIKSEANGILFFKEPIKAYILQTFDLIQTPLYRPQRTFLSACVTLT